MSRRLTIRNIIVYFLLAALIISGSSIGLDVTHQVLSSCHHKEEQTYRPQSLVSTDDFSEFEIVEKSTSISSITNKGYRRTGFSYKCNLFFLCMLAFLSEMFLFNRELFTLHNSRYIQRKQYHITFMQDMDGRKRIS